jgi:flagellar biosynthesis component FlhA
LSGKDLGPNDQEALSMLLALAVLLLVLAVVGGIAVHPLLFLIAVLAIVALFSGRRGAAY